MSEQTGMMTKKIARDQLVYWRNMMALRPEESEAIQNYASCLFTLGENEEALKYYPVAFDMNHSSSSIAMNYGMILKDLGRFAESARMVEHAYILDPDYFYL